MKKKPNRNIKGKVNLQKGAQPKPLKPSKIKTDKRQQLLMILFISVLTFIAFYPTLKHAFIDTWDDSDYVIDNRAIKSLSNFKEIVTTPVQGNYHPLTMLSLAFNYAISGEKATSFHMVNVLLHLLNVILVFFFVMRLTGRKPWIAFIAALLFGIHPIHVESVAWIAERKDVLYSFFFLCGLISYLKFLEKAKVVKLLPVLGFFILSLLSKPAAVIFPLVLLAIDYYYHRLRNISTYLEKIPFFLLSLGMGLLTVHAQTVQGAVADAGSFPVHFRFFFGFYGLMMYIFNTLVPIKLCTFYPFPAINVPLPMVYYLSPLFGILIIVLMFLFNKKHRIITFSILFYIINLLLVLQFMPVGSAIIADRYAYLPLIGVFIIPGYFFQKWCDQHSGKPPLSGMIILVLVSFTLTALAYRQSTTWKDSASLWDNTLAVKPSSRAYTNRALAYKKEGNREKAIELYTKAISMNKNESDALMNRGNVYFDMGKDDLALADYRKSLSLKKKSAKLFTNMGSLFGRQGNYDSSLFYLNLSVAIDPGYIEAYMYRGLCYGKMNRIEDAIAEYKYYLRFEPKDASVMSDIGIWYQALKKYKESLQWFDQAIGIEPEKGIYYMNRSVSWYSLGDKVKASDDAMKSKQLGAKVPEGYLEMLSR